MPSNSLIDLVPEARDRMRALMAAALAEGMTITPTSTLRTCAEQNALYAQGRTTPGAIITKARGCVSWHVLGRATDFNIISGPQDWDRLGAIGKSVGLKWGGDFTGFPDKVHFEYHPGMTIEEECPDPDDCTAQQARLLALWRSLPPSPVGPDEPAPSRGIQWMPLLVGAVAGYAAVEMWRDGRVWRPARS